MEGATPHPVKKVVLPGGKTIEVMLLAEPSGAERAHPPAPPAHPPAQPAQDLSVCVSCGCTMVFPADWEEAGPESWSVVLSCPNCGHQREGVFAQDNVERFDEQLDEGIHLLARDYRRLVRSNLAEETERFVAALRADALLPEDF